MSLTQAGMVGPRKLDISYPTIEFTKLLKLWDTFNETTMGIVVRHIKRFGTLHWSDGLGSLFCSQVLDYQTASLSLVNDRRNLYKNGARYASFWTCSELLLIVHYTWCPVKGPGKSSDASPHKPTKKQRLVDLPQRGSQVFPDYRNTIRSSNGSPDLPLKSAISNKGSTPSPDAVLESPDLYTSKGQINIKSPQLPFGENVAVATGPVGAS